MRKAYSEPVYELAEQLYKSATDNVIGCLAFDLLPANERDYLCEASKIIMEKVRSIYVKV